MVVGNEAKPPWDPRSDPTALTTDALIRERESQEKTIGLQIAALRELINERFVGADLVIAEKFRGVSLRFDLLEEQRKELKRDSEEQRKELKSDSAVSLAAALAAQKEQAEKQTTTFTASIEKSETSQVRQFDQISSNFKTEIAGIVGTLGDIKDRLTTIESIKRGGEESNVATRADRSDSRAALSVAAVVVGALVAIAMFALAAASFLGR